MEFIVILFNCILMTTLSGLFDFFFEKNNQEPECFKLAYQLA